MIFLEQLRMLDVARLLLGGQSAVYANKTLGARLAERIAARFGRHVSATRLGFGHVNAATGIRRKAYEAAESCMDSLPGKPWALDLSAELKIDFWLIVRKYFFDEYYNKFEFIEMALRHAEENPGTRARMRIDPTGLGDHAEKLARHFQLELSPSTSAWQSLGVLLLPLWVEIYWRRNGDATPFRLDGRLVCEVDDHKTFEMFANLFRDWPHDKPAFVCEARNAGAFTQEQDVAVLRLRPDGAAWLRDAVRKYVAACRASRSNVAAYGNHLFRIFYVVMRGRAEVLEGSGNLYCTYEHLVTVKAVRNEFLKAAGNRTVFVPLNSHVTPQYFHSEILVNYDVMCAAGPHTEILYRRKRALTEVYLPTGSYDSNRQGILPEGREARLSRLRAFKGGDTLITIISPGICDPTYSHEIKLMRLARVLSGHPGVKVAIRLKPVPPEPKYADFYAEQLRGADNILLTGGEYELFDFLPVTDLVLTSISNGAYDLAQAGAQVMFIDFLRDPEMTQPLLMAPGVLVAEEDVLPRVIAWAEDAAGVRRDWQGRVHAFADALAYQFADFEAYRVNFLAQIDKVAFPTAKAQHEQH